MEKKNARAWAFDQLHSTHLEVGTQEYLDSSARVVRVVYGRIMARKVDDSFIHHIVAVWEPRNGTQTLNPSPKPQVYTLTSYENLGHDVIRGAQNHHC